ncbi:Hsp70 family protein [Spirochaeta dissipatitropha]
MAHIGIKTADGKFYPITTDEGTSKKLLRLIPAREHQTSVQIDLYRGNPDTAIADSEYIGSLLLERIEPEQDGSRRIELVLQYDENHDLSATATDLGSGSYQSFSVSLDALSGNTEFDMPDFPVDDEQTDSVFVDSFPEYDTGEETDFERELESGLEDSDMFASSMPEPPSFESESHDSANVVSSDEDDSFPDEYESEDEPPVVRKLPVWFIALIALIVLAAAGLIAFGIFLLVRGSAAAALEGAMPVLLAWITAIG